MFDEKNKELEYSDKENIILNENIIDEFVLIQSDGGSEVFINKTSLLDYPKDGDILD